MSKVSRLVFLAAALSAPTCQGEGPLMNEEQFCAEYGRRECERIANVCSREMVDCQQIRAGACRAQAVRQHGEQRAFRPENADECLHQVSETYRNTQIRAEHWAALEAKCGRVFEGGGKANDACAVDADCESPLACDKRRCGPLRLVPAGANCANPGETCPAAEFCRPGDGVHVCTRRLARDMACGPNAECERDLRCRGACIDRLPFGAICESDDDCLSGYCYPYPPPGSSRTCGAGLSFAPFSTSCEAYFGTNRP